MIAGPTALRRLKPVEPFVESSRQNGMSYGLSHAGYDVRIDIDNEVTGDKFLYIGPGAFYLASTLEKFKMPKNLIGIVHDKSTWARRGLAVQNTVIEPGWEGYLTLELTNHGTSGLYIQEGDPIAQIIFHYIDEEVEGYKGKYQNQDRGPQEARFEA